MIPYLFVFLLFLLAGVPEDSIIKQELSYRIELSQEGARQQIHYYLHLESESTGEGEMLEDVEERREEGEDDSLYPL